MLHDIVEHKPTTLDALSQISGMGAWRLQKYGTHIIDVVNRFL
jgi:superfamily II DNA helicase RecQ